MQHPIPFHGQRFLVLNRNGVPNDNLQWKDTLLCRAGETVDLLVEMSNPGAWMAHSHIAEHIESHMMLTFLVQQPHEATSSAAVSPTPRQKHDRLRAQ